MAFPVQITWCHYGQYKITDVQDKQHDQVIQFMLEHFRSYRLFQVLKIQQEPGVENDFANIVKHILGNESSIVVVDSELNIKGVALLKCMTQAWRSWIDLQLFVKSERFRELCDMVRWCLHQETLDHNSSSGGDSLHIFSFHFCNDLQEDEEFLSSFFNAICEVARHMLMPRVTYMCLSQSDRERIKSLGFNEKVRVIYSLYMFKNKRPFDRLRDINEMYGVFYEKMVETLNPYYEMPIRHVTALDTEQATRKSKEITKQEIADVNKQIGNS